MKPKKDTKTAFANRIGISRSTLHQWEIEGAPIAKGAKAVLKWASDAGKELADPKEIRAAMQLERLGILKANRARIERENSIAAKETMLCADACRQSAEAMALVFSDMERDANELPPSCAGLDSISIFKILKARVERHRTDWKAKFQEVGQ